MKTKRVYVAGPVTGVPDWREKHMEAVQLLRDHGYEPVSTAMPEYFNADNAPKVSDDSIASWRAWMEYCLELLRHCDAIATMPGWSRSKGAYIEYLTARKFLDLDTIHLDELREKTIL